MPGEKRLSGDPVAILRFALAGAVDNIVPDRPDAEKVQLFEDLYAFHRGAPRPRIVCLCGSTRFGAAFQRAMLVETLAGHIVLTIGCDMRSDEALGLPPDTKARLDELHLRKIDLADEVFVLNYGGHIGASTRREINYAKAQNKALRYLEPVDA